MLLRHVHRLSPWDVTYLQQDTDTACYVYIFCELVMRGVMLVYAYPIS